MEFYNKFVDRFQDISKVRNPPLSKTKVNMHLLRAFKKNRFGGI